MTFNFNSYLIIISVFQLICTSYCQVARPAIAGNTSDPAHLQPPAPKHFKFTPRQPVACVSAGDGSAGPDDELRNYLVGVPH